MFGGEHKRQIKLREKEMDKERERERNLEKETTQGSSETDSIEHFSHPHPLVYSEANYPTFRCNSCTRRGKGKRYHCSQCEFDMHKICAQTPITWLGHHMTPEEVKTSGIHLGAADTFAHPQHKTVAEYSRKSFSCDHCKNSGDGLRFHCDACNVDIDQVCVENPTRLTSYLHPDHELELRLRPNFESCEFCRKSGHSNNRMYSCRSCEFYLHPRCSQWPLYVVHPLHPPHPLVLKPCDNVMYTCFVCRRMTGRYKYTCMPCGLDFDLHCIWHQSTLGLGQEVRQNHESHNITVLPITNLFEPERLQKPPKTALRMAHTAYGAWD